MSKQALGDRRSSKLLNVCLVVCGVLAAISFINTFAPDAAGGRGNWLVVLSLGLLGIASWFAAKVFAPVAFGVLTVLLMLGALGAFLYTWLVLG